MDKSKLEVAAHKILDEAENKKWRWSLSGDMVCEISVAALQELAHAMNILLIIRRSR